MTALEKKLVVVKIGGNALVNEEALASFVKAVVKLTESGFEVVVTHGGGPQISQELKKRGIASEFKAGYRVSSREVVSVVKEVLCDAMQEQIVSVISTAGKKAAGVCGNEGLFQCSKKHFEIDGERIDLQFVGEIDEIDISQVSKLLIEDTIPVVSSLGCDADGNLYNINADAGAAALAAALSAEVLCLLTDVDGVYASYPDKDSILHNVNDEDLTSLIAKVETGMIPKLEAAKAALDSGVTKVLIANGNSGDALKQSLIDNNIVGTMVQK